MERSGRLHFGQAKLIALIGVSSDMGLLPFTLELMPDYGGDGLGSRAKAKAPEHAGVPPNESVEKDTTIWEIGVECEIQRYRVGNDGQVPRVLT